MRPTRHARLLAFALLAGSSVPALAQSAPAEGDAALDEIIVAAQRRDENIQDVPLSVTAIGGDVVTDLGASGRGGKARNEVDDLGHRHEAVGVRALVTIARQPALPVRRQQAQGVPAFMPPGVGHLAALEDHVVDRALGEEAAHGEAGMAGPDDEHVGAHRQRLPSRRVS